MTPIIETIHENVCVDDDVLLCPRCGFNCMHHYRVTAFNRKEDDARVQKTDIVTDDLYWGGGSAEVRVSLVKNTSDNPSSRRHGITMCFFCEGCHGKFKLSIDQHKGQTSMRWSEL
jgi:hypothetical protein